MPIYATSFLASLFVLKRAKKLVLKSRAALLVGKYIILYNPKVHCPFLNNSLFGRMLNQSNPVHTFTADFYNIILTPKYHLALPRSQSQRGIPTKIFTISCSPHSFFTALMIVDHPFQPRVSLNVMPKNCPHKCIFFKCTYLFQSSVVKIKTKAFLCLVCNHANPTHERAKPYLHEFLKSAAIVREWSASCWAALPLGKDSRYPLDIRLDRSQGLAKRCDKKKYLCPFPKIHYQAFVLYCRLLPHNKRLWRLLIVMFLHFQDGCFLCCVYSDNRYRTICRNVSGLCMPNDSNHPSHDREKVKCNFYFRLASFTRWARASQGYGTTALLYALR